MSILGFYDLIFRNLGSYLPGTRWRLYQERTPKVTARSMPHSAVAGWLNMAVAAARGIAVNELLKLESTGIPIRWEWLQRSGNWQTQETTVVRHDQPSSTGCVVSFGHNLDLGANCHYREYRCFSEGLGTLQRRGEVVSQEERQMLFCSPYWEECLHALVSRHLRVSQ